MKSPLHFPHRIVVPMTFVLTQCSVPHNEQTMIQTAASGSKLAIEDTGDIERNIDTGNLSEGFPVGCLRLGKQPFNLPTNHVFESVSGESTIPKPLVA